MSVRIAMWSGPRNISTALMRSFEARGDCWVTDEPLYGHYLGHTGLPHPGADEVMNAQSLNWREVVAELTGPVPGGKAIWYQKHMAHHLLANIERYWLADLRHCLLIRRPDEVLASYLRTRDSVTLEDLGYACQVQILNYASRELGQRPIVIDSGDVLRNPNGLLRALCRALEIPFTESMLRWEPGLRQTDGVWAKYWYDNVKCSTGFAPYRSSNPVIAKEFEPILAQAQPLYEQLHACRLPI